MDDVVDQENNEKSVDAYDQFVGAEVFLPDERGRKMMARVTNRMKYNKGDPRGIEQPVFFRLLIICGFIYQWPNGRADSKRDF